MYELSANEYSQVTPLFGGLEVDKLVVQLVLNGTYPGRIFVNCRNESTAALIDAGTCYLGGNESDTAFVGNLQKLLATEIVPGASGKPLFIFATTDRWRDRLDALLSSDTVMRIRRHKFVLDPERFKEHHGWRGQVPDEYEVRRVDRELVASLPGHALEYWRTTDNFLSRGCGYAVVGAGKVVSACWTMLVGEDLAEVAVQTDEGYRRQGLARLAASAWIEHCLEEGLQAEWDCFELVPSMNLARKLGFVKKLDVEVHFVR